MAALYRLEIVTPVGSKFDGMVDYCVFRSTEGDVGILKGHSPYVAAIETGEIKIRTEDGQTRYAAASDGFVHVTADLTRILVSSCEWAEEIDPDQAKEEKEAARAKVAEAKTPEERELAKYVLQKARIRRRVAKKRPDFAGKK